MIVVSNLLDIIAVEEERTQMFIYFFVCISVVNFLQKINHYIFILEFVKIKKFITFI